MWQKKGATGRSFSSTTKGRASSAASIRSSPCRAGEPRRPLLDHDHRSAHRPAFPEQHHSVVALLAAHATGTAKQLVSGAQQHRARRATISSSAPCRRTRTSTRCASTTRSAGTVRSSGATPTRRYANRTTSNLLEIGDRLFEQDTKNWQVSHTWAIEVEPGESVPGRPGRSAGRPERDRLPSGRRRLPAADRRLHQPARHPARVPEHRHPGLLGHGRRGQCLLGEQPADVGHQQHHDLRGRPPHAELRPELSELAAAAGSGHRVPGRLRLQCRLHGKPGRRHAARGLHERRPVPAGRVQRAGPAGEPARVQLHVRRPVRAGRLARELERSP